MDPDDPSKAYLAIGYAIKPGGKGGGGGIYCSQDAGKSWKWLSQGLPERRYFFFVDPWNTGREVAAGPGGNVLCISKFGAGIWRLDAATQTWVKADVKLDGQPYCVTADLLKPGTVLRGRLPRRDLSHRRCRSDLEEGLSAQRHPRRLRQGRCRTA